MLFGNIDKILNDEATKCTKSSKKNKWPTEMSTNRQLVYDNFNTFDPMGHSHHHFHTAQWKSVKHPFTPLSILYLENLETWL